MAVERASPSALSHFDPADLLDALSTGIIMLDAQLCPVYANVAAQDLLAFSLNMARGRPFADFLHDAEGLCRILRRALETGEGIADRELAVRPAGALRGAAQLLERELPAAELKEYTQVIIAEADRLTALVDSMSGPSRAPSKI